MNLRNTNAHMAALLVALHAFPCVAAPQRSAVALPAPISVQSVSGPVSSAASAQDIRMDARAAVLAGAAVGRTADALALHGNIRKPLSDGFRGGAVIVPEKGTPSSTASGLGDSG